MSENQKLREALQAISHIDDTTNHSVDASAALDRIGQIARQALTLPTAAPEMPLSMNQFGRLVELTREHLSDNTFVYKATSKTGDTCHFGVESAAKAWAKGGTVEAIKVREFKLHTGAPTADHLPDAGKMVVDHFPDATKMIETAVPVGELERFEAWWRSVQLMTFPKEYDIERLQDWGSSYKPKALDAWQARAALSAGDAVDARRYRWLKGRSQLCLSQVWFGGYTTRQRDGDFLSRDSALSAIESAIDAAMRKDKT